MATILFPAPIFGPIHSRRLGVSLGINLLPADGKYCSFDCIYCECGYNKDFISKTHLPTRESVRSELELKLQSLLREGTAPDVLTFAGNGEPTAHPHFAEIIDDTLLLRDRYFPNAKVSVLSNAAHINRPKVFLALLRVDNNILKLDTVDENYIRQLDRPVARYQLNEIIEKMKEFGSQCIIQTMFLKGTHDGVDMDNTTDRLVMPWLKTVKEIGPRQVMIYTIDRETPDLHLQKATRNELDRIAEMVRENGLEVSVSY